MDSKSVRSKKISSLLKDQAVRKAYIWGKVAVLVPSQIRALRGQMSMPRQSDLARAAATHQSRISLLETPGENVTLETLSGIAAAFGVGLTVKFVSFSEMLRWENDFSPDGFTVIPLERDREFLEPADAAQTRQSISERVDDSAANAAWPFAMNEMRVASPDRRRMPEQAGNLAGIEALQSAGGSAA